MSRAGGPVARGEWARDWVRPQAQLRSSGDGLATLVRALLIVFVFVVPWEWSLDLGEPLGNVARLAGLALLAAAVLAALRRLSGRDGMGQAGLRRADALGWLALALWLWMGTTYLWTVDEAATAYRMRAIFQEVMVVWVAWEFVETAQDLRAVLRAFVAGCVVLAGLTIGNFLSASGVAEQVRSMAAGQDPNDVARLLDLGFAPAALLVASDRSRWLRLLGLVYLPLGLGAVVLTASRGGAAGVVVAMVGTLALLLLWRPGVGLGVSAGLAALGAAGLAVVPSGALERLATLPEQLSGGGLNERANIWASGWHAFLERPWTGWGAGAFAAAARVSPDDTAHNTLLSVMVTGGLVGLGVFLAALAVAVRGAWQTRGLLRQALGTMLASWAVTAMGGSAEENRATWVMLALCVVAARLTQQDRDGMVRVFAGAAARDLAGKRARGTAVAGR